MIKSTVKTETVKALLSTVTDNGTFLSLTYLDKTGKLTFRTIRVGVTAHLVERPTEEERRKAEESAKRFRENNPFILRAWDATADREGRKQAELDGKTWDSAMAYRSFYMDRIVSLRGKGVDMDFIELTGRIHDLIVWNNGFDLYIMDITTNESHVLPIPAGKAKLETRSKKVLDKFLKEYNIKLYTLETNHGENNNK